MRARSHTTPPPSVYVRKILKFKLFNDQNLGFGVWGFGFGVWGLGFGVWGLGYATAQLRRATLELTLPVVSFPFPFPSRALRILHPALFPFALSHTSAAQVHVARCHYRIAHLAPCIVRCNLRALCDARLCVIFCAVSALQRVALFFSLQKDRKMFKRRGGTQRERKGGGGRGGGGGGK